MFFRPVFILFTLFFSSAFSLAQIEKYDFPSAVTKLEIVHGNGNIRVTSSTQPGKTSVFVNKVIPKPACKYVVELKTGVLSITQDTNSTVHKSECQADIDISLANSEDIAADVDLDSGKLNLSGFSGTLDLKINRGDVSVTDAFIERIEGSIERGDLSIRGKIGPGAVTLSDGNMNLAFKQFPQFGQLILLTKRGNIDVEMPYETDLQSTSSLSSPQVTRSQGSAFSLQFLHPKGNLSIKRK